jgi:hypothetical protein
MMLTMRMPPPTMMARYPSSLEVMPKMMKVANESSECSGRRRESKEDETKTYEQ